MKKRILALLLIMVMTLTGCSFNSVLKTVKEQKDKVIKKIEDIVDKVEDQDALEAVVENAKEVTEPDDKKEQEDSAATEEKAASGETTEEKPEEKEAAQNDTKSATTSQSSNNTNKNTTTTQNTNKQQATTNSQPSNKNTETKEETKTEQKKEETKEPEPGALDASWKAEAKSNASSYSSYFTEILSLVNELRAEEGVAPLTLNNKLCEASCYRAVEIYHSGQFSHTRPDGTPANTVLDEYGITWYAVGENLASGNAGPADAVEIWKNSPAHNANMLDKDFTRLGVGCVKSGSTFYWVQLFTN